MKNRVCKPEAIMLFGTVFLGLGALASYLRRSAKSDRAHLARELEETRQAVAQLQTLAADEAAIYLRGYMKGQADADGQSPSCA